MAEETNGMEQTPMVNDQTTPEPVDVNQAEPTVEVPKVEQPKPVEPVAVEPVKPMAEEQAKPAEAKPVQPKLTETKPVQTKSKEAKPIQPVAKKQAPVAEVKIDPVKVENELTRSMLSAKNPNELLFNYEFGANKKGKIPYVQAKLDTNLDQFERKVKGYRQLDPNYKQPNKNEFDDMANYAMRKLYSQGVWDKYKDNPAFISEYVNNYVNRVSTKDGFYLSDDDKKKLAERIVGTEYNRFKTLTDNVGEAIKRSGIITSSIERTKNAEKEIADAYSSANQAAKDQSFVISKEVDEQFLPEKESLKADQAKADEAISTTVEQIYTPLFETEYKKRFNLIQQAVNSNQMSIEEARSLVDPDENGNSILSNEVNEYVKNSPEFKQPAEAFAKEQYDILNKRAYDLNSRINKTYNEKVAPVIDQINSDFKNTQASLQSKVGFTKADMEKLDKALYDMSREKEDRDYVRSKDLSAMALIPEIGGAVKSIEFVSKLKSASVDMLSGLYNNLTGRLVNEMDVNLALERANSNGINARLLFERDGISAAFNPAVIAGTVGGQIPVLASFMAPAIGTGSLALNAGRLMKLNKWGLSLVSGGVGGATEFALVGAMVRDEARSQALSMGASPEDVDKATNMAFNTWLPSAPLYFLQMGALLSPSLSFTKKIGAEYATEFLSEHWEGISNRAGLESITPEVDLAGNPTGKTQYKGLTTTIGRYLSSAEFKETSAAVVWTTAILGTGIGALGSNPKLKIEKATLLDMFSKAGRIVPDAMLEQNFKAGKITQEEYNLGKAKVQAMQSAIDKVGEMGLTDDLTIYAAVDKLYDINTLESQIASSQDPDVKETLQSQLDQAKKDLRNLTIGKSGVYIRENPGTGPMILSKQDMDQAINDPEVIDALNSGNVRFSISNDPEMTSKINEMISQYKGTIESKINQMSSESSQEGKMSVQEAYELATLQAKQEMLGKVGREMDPNDMMRMSELSSKGSINLAAYERRQNERKNLEGVTESFINKAKSAMSRAFPNSKVINDREEFIAATTEALKTGEGVTNVTYDAPSKSFIIEKTDGQNEVIKLSSVAGFNAGNGKIFINPENNSIDTIVHELGGHSWVNEMLSKSQISNVAPAEGQRYSVEEILSANDSDLNEFGKKLKEGLELMRNTDYFEEIKLKSFYSGRSEAKILEEALVTAIGERGGLKVKKTKLNADGSLSMDPTLLERITNLIKDLVKLITGKQAQEGQELRDYVDSALKDIFGRETFESEMTQAEAQRLAQPSGFSDAEGNVLSNREVNFMIRNDLVVDFANEVKFEYIKDSDQFKKLIEDGFITVDKTLSDFAGKYVVFHTPDNSFTGNIFKGQDKIVEGKGGVYYVVRFNDDGYVWASTERGAAPLANSLNRGVALSTDGKTRLALVSTAQDKLLSSTLNSNALLDIMFSKAFDDRIKFNSKQIVSAYVKALSVAKDLAKKEGNSIANFPTITKSESAESARIKLEQFFASDVSTFEDRRNVNKSMLQAIAEEAKKRFKSDESLKNFSAQFLDFFGELTGNEKLKTPSGKDIDKISKDSLIRAVSNFLTEPLLKGQEPGKVYAIIEIDGEVEPFNTNLSSEKHESYPFAVRAKNGSKPVLHILQDRQDWIGNAINPETGNKITKEDSNKIIPTQQGISRPVKLADDIKKVDISKMEPKFMINGDAVKPTGRVFTTPHYAAESVANNYVLDNNLPPIAKTIVKALDIDVSMQIADAYDALESKPNDPEVLAGYRQMGEESVKQFDHMVKSGYSIEVYTGDGEPYATAADMIKDLNENKHLFILKTKEEAFGQSGDFTKFKEDTTAKSPLLESSGRFDINGVELLNNDVFRAVHDFFGHAVMGNSFGPVGEENAWLIHSQMYSPLARRAMTSETRMQNSWVNFNRSMRTVKIDEAEGDNNAIAATTSFMKSLPEEIKELLLYQWKAKQNPKWHPEGNTLKHAIMVIRRAYRMFPNDNNMIIAALFHDLGKVDTYSISEKTGQPTAYGHEKKSVEYINKFKSWISSQPGADIDEITYLVQNHMKIKPSTWEQMSAPKKEMIEKHKSFQKLVNFTEKLDKGGTDIGYIKNIIAGDVALKDANSTSKALKSVLEADEKRFNGTSIEGRTDFESIASEYYNAKSANSGDNIISDVEKVLGVGMRPAKAGEEGFVPLSQRKFAEQKNVLSPDWVVDTSVYLKQYPIIGDDSQVKFKVNDENFPKDKNVNAIRNSDIYGEMTEDGQGNFVFFHVSYNDKLDKIGVNPNKFGLNSLKTGAEERMRSVPVAMYYVNTESDITYSTKYFTKIPKNKVYYFNADALKLKDKAKAAFEADVKKKGYNLAYTPNEQVGYMLLEARKLGYEMIIAKWGHGKVRAETNMVIKPGKFFNLNGNIIEYVHRERFLSNRNKAKNKKIAKSDMLASERTYEWYDKAVSKLLSSGISKNDFAQMMQTGKFVIMTSENPDNKDYFEYENDNLISDFEDEMRRLELNYIPIIGKYGKFERSFIVTDVTPAIAKQLSKTFNQESVAADFGIYYPAKNTFFPRVKDADVFMDGKMSADDDFMSTIKTTDGPVTFSLSYDFNKEKKYQPKFQVIGVEGARNVSSVISGYNVALDMEVQGMSPKQIFAATGWFRDFAGNMAYDIDDVNAEIKMFPTEQGTPLSDILDHPILYQMYPQIKDIVVKSYENPDGSYGSLIVNKKGQSEIYVNSSSVKEKDTNLLYSIVMHEVQHVIQGIEGFDTGSSLKRSISQLNYIRESIFRMNERIGKGEFNLSDEEYDRYLNGIDIDVTILESIEKVIKESKKQGAKTSDVAYLYNYGEMMARYSEEPLSNKEIKITPMSKMMDGNFITLSLKRIQNIHDAFFNGSGKITTGPGQKINIPGFKVDDDIQRKHIMNEAMARGTTMKAGANYYSGVKETQEEKEERLKLRDQIMLEIMAAKQAYEQRSAEAAVATEYEKRKRDIEEAFRMQDMENRISAKLNRKIRREQVISAFRWLGEKEKWQDKIANWDGMKQLIFERIEEYRKNGDLAGKINARTLSTFSKMILNATTEKRLNRALAYLDKALEDKQYGELVGNIRDLKAAIKNMIRGGKNPFGNYYNSVVELISYDESNLFNPYGDRSFAVMEMYRDMLDQLARKDMPNFKSYINNFHLIQDMLEASVDNEIADQAFNEAKTAAELNEYIDKFYALPINNEVDYMAIRKISSAINKRAKELYSQGVITADEFAEIFAKISKGSKSSEITQPEIKNKVRDMEAQMFSSSYYRMNLLDPNQFSGDNKKAFLKLRAMLNKPNGIEDFRNAGTDSLILLEKVVDQLEGGFMSYRIHELINTVEVQKDAEMVATEISKAIDENQGKPFRRKFSQSAVDIASKLTGMPKQIVDQALGLGKTKPFYDAVASKLARSFSGLRSSNKELGRMVYNSLQKFGGLMSMSQNERYRVGIILKQLDYQSNIPNFETSEVIKDVTGYLLSEKGSEITGKEYKAIKEAYDSLPKNDDGTLDVEAALKSLTKREKNLYDTSRTLFDKHLSPKVAATNERRGEIAENQTNYYRRFSQGVRSSEIADNVAPEDFVRNLETYKVRSGSTISRVSNGLYWTVVDPEAVLFRSINDVNTDYYLSQDIPRAFSVLREASKKSKGQSKAIIDALAIMTRETLVDELTINRNTANPAGLFSLDGMITRASNMARNLLLSSPLRIITELVPSVAKYLISEANIDQLNSFFTSKKAKDSKLYRQLYYDFNLPFRDNITRYSLEGGDSGRRSVMAAAADAVSTFSDALFSKGVFKISFDETFRSMTGEDFDIDRYYSDERYRAKLDALGVMEQAVTDGLYRAERLASSLTQFTSPLSVGFTRRSSASAKVWGFMMSYNAFESKTFFENFRDVITGENEGRIAGARYVSGVIASNTMYGFLGYFMNQLFKSVDLDDEDPIDEEIKQAMQATVDKKSAGNLLIASCANLIVGGYGAVGKVGLGFLIGLVESLRLNGYKMDPDTEAKYKEFTDGALEYARVTGINFSDRYGATTVADATSFIPLFGIYVTPVIDATTTYAAVYDKKSRGEEVTNEEEATYRAIAAMHALANFAGLQYPGMALIHKSLISSANDAAKKSKALKEYYKKYKKKEESPYAPTIQQLQDAGLDITMPEVETGGPEIEQIPTQKED